MKHPQANGLCVRQTYNTHKDSTFATLKWATERLGVQHLWDFRKSPLECEYKPTGQMILFRGFDDVLKLTSITVPVGKLCWVWIEEAYEIDDPHAFRTLDESIRGELPDGLWHQLTLTYNPWVNQHWTKARFWDNVDPKASTFTTTYKCNEWLTEGDIHLIESLEHTDPDRYKVVALGEYGIPGGAFFDEFRTDIHVCEPFVIPKSWTRYRSIDYGLDMLACLWYAVDPYNNVYVYKELHESDLIISAAANRILHINGDDVIRTTYAPPDLMARRQDTGLSAFELFQRNGVPLYKSGNNRINGWLSVKEGLKVIEKLDEQTGLSTKTSQLRIFKNCTNLINYLPQIQRDEREPNDCSSEPHYLTHIVDSLRYYCVNRFKGYEATNNDDDQDDHYRTKTPQDVYGTGRNANQLAKWG
jgi:phage terminase large subunit